MHWSIEQSIAPTIEPVSIADMKDHARVETAADDTLIAYYVRAARQIIEEWSGRQLITATWKLYLDAFPAQEILVPRPPLQSVSSISYVDTNGDDQPWDSNSYRVDTKSEPGRITEAYGESWPSPRNVANAVTVTCAAGYGDNRHDVPGPIRQALMLFVGHLYEHRESVTTEGVPREMPFTVRALIGPYRVTDSDYPGR